MSWTFSYEGKIFDPHGNVAGSAYAGGFCGANPEGINNVDMQFVHDIGPIPYGPKADGTPNGYTFGTPVDHSQLGAFAIPLIPDADNNMGGRSDLFCHGDTAVPFQASDGCVVTNPTLRHTMVASTDQRMQVVPVFNGAVS